MPRDAAALRLKVRETLTMNAFPRQMPRCAEAFARSIGYRGLAQHAVLIGVIRDEAERLHINLQADPSLVF